MRRTWLVCALALAAGCAERTRPYRFAAPMLAAAALPPESLRAPRAAAARDRGDPLPREAPVRSALAPRVRTASMPASAADAAAVAATPAAAAEARGALPAPHRGELAAPPLRTLADLRARVGHREARDPTAVVLGWLRELGTPVEATTGADVVAWAETRERLLPAAEVPRAGDVLVFDHAVGDDEADLIAIAIATDDRGVGELIYVGGGVVRRGFVDTSRRTTRRDPTGAVVNTFIRHGRRWPARGSHYLTGELLAHVVRMK